MNDFSGCYVVLDRDMEELIFDTMVFRTYEKALNYVQNAIKDGQDINDKVFQEDENSWIMQNDGEQPRIIEISNKAIW